MLRLRLRTAAVLAAAALTLSTPLTPTKADDQTGWQPLATTAARTDNPLKGFMPFGDEVGDNAASFPHTMEWFYLPLKAVVKGEKTYDWTEFETKLEAIKARGHQAAFRFYLDYPKKETGVPDYLLGPGGIDQSRTYTVFENDNISFSPDYEDPRIQALITDFVAAFGAKYDGDPRIGFITTGLVGFWGEQHTWPMNGEVSQDNPKGENWMPDRQVELSFYQAWDQAFDKTRLLNRQPAADLAQIDVGFHDDSFAFSTLPTIDWHFMSRMKQAGLEELWKTKPIGGEVYPGIQLCLFDPAKPCEEKGAKPENFDEAVQGTHASWLINHRAWSPGFTGEPLERAKAAHASLGYDFAATQASITTEGDKATVSLRVTNRGVAPFYYDWPVEFAVLDADGKVLSSTTVDANLPSLQPKETAEWTATLPAEVGTVVVRIPNVMPGGAPIRFANTGQDADFPGYLTVGSITTKQSPNPVPSAPATPKPAPGLPKTGIIATR
ncbi:MAG: DUF4832 domain-containing protein [Propionibacteriaceae bacterium]|nr:DUF4832 domain-containing protein [Propionibacteriaceae bacterium]